ncbi:hypothetical protein [Nodularia sphaerocarpa]|uniref:hypothetical protein n=1 Tax=Nodularia sphaerocarpa TaxID=137816 RepID=UPI001EFB5120|nr:hypothetical protein [Nodularia sphaerocarpa]MDB9375503.1 hypothetical protein [Nodularia sphaerocarpa CS-585]MDB9377737.1 hypothetical protein [Nodularia sphaerocarpa CS-585A2]ULP74427.1 hypothetical protein BDGGKGIB_04095 [Nodularia sphaerocarpa UHCC 0038]
MRKTTFFTLAFSLLLVLPAMAQLGKVWTDFQFYSLDMQNYLINNLGDTLRPLEIRGQNALNNSTGELNIPNPVEAGKSFRQDILFNPTTDKFENNPVIQANAVSNEINRLITRGSVESVMGRNGQIRFKAKLQNTETILDNIEEVTQNSDNIFQEIVNAVANLATQNPLASLENQKGNLQLQAIKVQQEQAKIMGETLAQTMQTNQSLQYSNLNLANISQQMEVMNRSRRVDSATETARLIRTTAQIDLFGREDN